MPKVTEMFAYVASDKDADDEGVIGAKIGDNWMPLVGADPARAEALLSLAQVVANTTGKEVRLLRFTGPVEVVVTLVPRGQT